MLSSLDLMFDTHVISVVQTLVGIYTPQAITVQIVYCLLKKVSVICFKQPYSLYLSMLTLTFDSYVNLKSKVFLAIYPPCANIVSVMNIFLQRCRRNQYSSLLLLWNIHFTTKSF